MSDPGASSDTSSDMLLASPANRLGMRLSASAPSSPFLSTQLKSLLVCTLGDRASTAPWSWEAQEIDYCGLRTHSPGQRAGLGWAEEPPAWPLTLTP